MASKRPGLAKAGGLLLALCLSLAAAACGSSGGTGTASADSAQTSGPALKGKPIIIGMDSDSTGPASSYNPLITQGVQGAIAYVNAHGGVLGRPLKLFLTNSQSNPAEGPAVYNDMITHGAVAAIGAPVGPIQQAKQIIQNAKLLTIATQATDTSLLTPPSGYLYMIAPTSTTYADAFCAAFKAIHATRIALFHDNSPGVLTVANASIPVYEKCGVTFVDQESAPVTQTDFTAIAARIKASHPQAIYTISVGGSFQAAAETAFYQAMPNVQRFTLGAWPSQPAAWKAAAPGSLNGSVVIDTIDPENPRTKAVANMLAPYLPSSWTMSQYAADGYDALMLISEAIKKAGGTAEPALNAAFQTIQNFPTTFGQPSSTLSFSATKNSGSNGACSLVLKEFNANNTLTQDWGTFQPSC